MSKRAGRWVRAVALTGLLLALTGVAGVGHAGRIRILEADTLRAPNAPRPPMPPPEAEPGRFEIIIGDEGDSSQGRIEVRTPRWRRGSREERAGLLRFGEDILVEEGKVIEGDVVAIGGDAEIRGRVDGDVVAIGGDVILRSGSVVDGDAVAIGGTLHKFPGARLFGSDVGMRFLPTRFLGIPHGLHPTAKISLAIGALFFHFLVGWLLSLVMGDRLRTISLHVRAKLWPSFFAGLAIFFLAPPAFLLLLVTIVGIPLAILLPLILGLIFLIGYLTVASFVGSRVLGDRSTEGSGWVKGLALGLSFFVGAILLAELMASVGGLIGVMGGALSLFAWAGNWTAAVIGGGALLLSRLGRAARVPAPPVIPPRPDPRGAVGGPVPSPEPPRGG